MDKPLILPIKQIIDENSSYKTFVFEYALNSKAGQFVMLWLPGVDEKPMAVSYDSGKEFWITVSKIGPFTSKMFELKVGDKIGIRGPYGNFFRINENQKVIIIGGGCGVAPLYSILTEAKKKNCQVDFILGSRNKDFIFFEDNIKKFDNVILHVTTDDGSYGIKGFTTDVLNELIKNYELRITNYENLMILTCGPEMMMKRVSDIAFDKGIKCQLSFERYMKCGFGICGNCCLDPDGIRVCKEGPIFYNEMARKIKDFGNYYRDAEGRKVPFGWKC